MQGIDYCHSRRKGFQLGFLSAQAFPVRIIHRDLKSVSKILRFRGCARPRPQNILVDGQDFIFSAFGSERFLKGEFEDCRFWDGACRRLRLQYLDSFSSIFIHFPCIHFPLAPTDEAFNLPIPKYTHEAVKKTLAK